MMEKRFYRSLLSVAVAAILFPGSALALCDSSQLCTIKDGTAIWDNSGNEYYDSLKEMSGDNGQHKMIVSGFDIKNFETGYQFTNWYHTPLKTVISLGGGNGANASDKHPQLYDDLHLSVLDSSIKGTIEDQWFWAGLYARTDSEGATVAIESNAVIDLTATRIDPEEWIQGAGIYAEHKGEAGHSQVILKEGSDITITMQSNTPHAEYNSGVLAYAESGSAAVHAKKGTSITTSGFGTAGIKTHSRDGSVVIHEGTLNNHSESGRGILSHAVDGSTGDLSIANLAGGNITMTGVNGTGIKAYSAGSGNIDIYNAGSITLKEGWDSILKYSSSSAMYMQTHTDKKFAAENVQMQAVNEGLLTTYGDTSEGMRAESSIDSGTVKLVNSGTIAINGTNSTGIMGMSTQRENRNPGTALIQILNSGTIALGELAANSTGIKSNNGAEKGSVAIANTGEITAAGSSSTGISAFANQDTSVWNEGSITVADGSGIIAQSRDGEAKVVNSGDISVEATSESGYGIHALSDTGIAAVRHSKGKLSVSGNSIGIAAGGNGTQAIQLDRGTHVDASKGLGGLLVSGSGTGQIAIQQGAAVIGGSAEGFAVKYSGPSGTRAAASPAFTLDNAGTIGALSDLAFVAESASGSQITLNNMGSMTGYLRADGGNISLNNHNTLNLRSFSDTDGDQQRDTKQVAMMQFGEGENRVDNRQGALIQLADVSGESRVDTTGQFSSQGAKGIDTVGINQGQMLNVNHFSNAGTLNLAVNQLAGDILAITGNSSLAGQSVHDGGTIGSGGGSFTSDGGKLILDTVLNEGGSAAQSDVLVVDNAEKGSAATTIVINNLGGSGALTEQDGIQVVNVLGEANKDAFTLAGSPLKAGAYEYTLEQGSLSNPANQSFYLRTNEQQINPDVGGYLANQTMATGLFMHSLHDRMGEPQYTQRYKGDERTVPGLWLRAVASNTKSDAAGRSLSQDSNCRVMHLGGDLTRWESDNGDRYHLGVMGAWGKADTVSRSKATGSSSRSKVDGYGVGAYLTWYNKAEQQEGWYGDLWGMYNWFSNTADSAKDYDSKSWVASLEAGHASTVKPFEAWRWMVEPQAQVSYAHYSTDSITDNNGLKISNEDANSVSTRLGVRTYLQPTAPNDKAKFQPFLTVNWLWSDASNSMDFNGATFSSDMPKNRFEAKLGLQAEVRKDFHIYGQISGQVGENNYSHKAGQLGIRYNF